MAHHPKISSISSAQTVGHISPQEQSLFPTAVELNKSPTSSSLLYLKLLSRFQRKIRWDKLAFLKKIKALNHELNMLDIDKDDDKEDDDDKKNKKEEEEIEDIKVVKDPPLQDLIILNFGKVLEKIYEIMKI